MPKRDLNISKRDKLALEAWRDILLKEMPKHQTAPKTIELIEALGVKVDAIAENKQCANHAKRMSNMERIMYGDKKTGEIGIARQIDEVHKFFISYKSGLKIIKGVAIFISVVTAGGIAFVKFFRAIV